MICEICKRVFKKGGLASHMKRKIPCQSKSIEAKDIVHFFTKSTRNNNDMSNKIREQILPILNRVPKEFIESEYGEQWSNVSHAWENVLCRIAEESKIEYSSISVQIKGGRGYNYDADIIYQGEQQYIRKIEFKNGALNIKELPQFLSLQAGIPIFPVTYDTFWFDYYLDLYMRCDSGITELKPDRELYLKTVKSIRSDVPFFVQLKERESIFQKEKNRVVNDSITDYLTQYGHTINILLFKHKLFHSQEDKIFILWKDHTFHIDRMPILDEIQFHSIKNGNMIVLQQENTLYKCLLRWRNHKGILNPTWQISLSKLKN